jgi:hypothetical protein
LLVDVTSYQFLPVQCVIDPAQPHRRPAGGPAARTISKPAASLARRGWPQAPQPGGHYPARRLLPGREVIRKVIVIIFYLHLHLRSRGIHLKVGRLGAIMTYRKVYAVVKREAVI